MQTRTELILENLTLRERLRELVRACTPPGTTDDAKNYGPPRAPDVLVLDAARRVLCNL